MDTDTVLVWMMLFVLGVVILLVLLGIGFVAGYIASWLGFTGVMWWAVTLVFYIVIGGLIAMINRIGV